MKLGSQRRETGRSDLSGLKILFQDIQNTNSVDMVMINGRLYNTDSMNEIGNVDKKRTKFFWELDAYNDNFEWHIEEKAGFMYRMCLWKALIKAILQ